MACDRCGAPCQGTRCRGCERIDGNEARYGTDSTPDGAEWAVDQQGLDGEPEGQATLDGGISKPTGGED